MINLDSTTFEDEVRRAGDNLSPVRAGLLLAREVAYPALRPSDCLRELDELAARSEDRLRAFAGTEAGGVEARAEGLAEFLFKIEGFRGNRDEYGDPRNSYINQVLARRLGLPITLSVLYLELAQRLGLPASGVGMPGHFIVSVMGEDGPLYFDPFNGGRKLSVADCLKLVQGALGDDAAFDPDWLKPAEPRDVVARMLNNLRGFYIAMDDWPPAIAIVEHLILLQPEVPGHLRDLGVLHYRNGSLGRASELLNEYLRRDPSAPDVAAVRQGRDRLRQELARLN